MHPLSRWLIGAACCCVLAVMGCGGNNPILGSTPTPPSTTPPATTPIPVAAKVKFVYTGNQGASLSGYSVDTSTGALTALNGFPLPIGLTPTVVATDPQNRFLFVGDISASKLHVFTLNNSSGAPSEIGSSPYATVKEPVAIAVDPSGTHLYVTDQGTNTVGGFSLSETGALVPIVGSPFAASGKEDFGVAMLINAAGTFAYVLETGNVYTFGVNASSGALTLIQTIPGPVLGDDFASTLMGHSYMPLVLATTRFWPTASIRPPAC